MRPFEEIYSDARELAGYDEEWVEERKYEIQEIITELTDFINNHFPTCDCDELCLAYYARADCYMSLTRGPFCIHHQQKVAQEAYMNFLRFRTTVFKAGTHKNQFAQMYEEAQFNIGILLCDSLGSPAQALTIFEDYLHNHADDEVALECIRVAKHKLEEQFSDNAPPTLHDDLPPLEDCHVSLNGGKDSEMNEAETVENEQQLDNLSSAVADLQVDEGKMKNVAMEEDVKESFEWVMGV
jgi:hypothetical protein